MALGTLTKIALTTFGNKRVRVFDVVPTSGANYTTGGETISPTSVGLHKIEWVMTDAGAKNAAGTLVLPVRFDYTANKLQVYRYDGASAGKASLEEAASNFDASGFTARLIFVGT